jgi:hypothetical protein
MASLGEERGMKTPEEWWDELSDNDREAYLACRGKPLPEGLKDKALAAGIKVKGVQPFSPTWQFWLPDEFRAFLDEVAADEPTT